MKKYIAALLLTISFSLGAQVTFVIDSLPDYTPAEDILFIAGDFQGWNPGDPAYALHKNDDDKWTITLDSVAEGITYKFKFTRGDWEKVEKGLAGEEIPDREFTFGNDSTVSVIIFNWADFGSPGESTAAWNVSVMDENFYMPQLDRERRIWLYLPPDYDSTDNSYPVIYMHDGQNIFDQKTSFAGEWEVDETLNNLAEMGYEVPIVVGIDNGGEFRTDELTPWVHPQYGGGQGDEYMAFIVETLKPYIDENYRTLTDRDNTGIIGSSLGGLISNYGAIKYQEVFSKSGPFSPAYWINYDSIFNYISNTGIENEIRFYQNVGENEGDAYVNMMYEMEDSLKSVGFENVVSKVITGGDHNEQTWREDFSAAYLYLFVSYANDISERRVIKPLQIHPNPANERISFARDEITDIRSLRIIDQSGKIVFEKEDFSDAFIDVNGFPGGIYVISIVSSEGRFAGRFVKN